MISGVTCESDMPTDQAKRMVDMDPNHKNGLG